MITTNLVMAIALEVRFQQEYIHMQGRGYRSRSLWFYDHGWEWTDWENPPD